MFLDETIDPDIPTDPNELALYKRYGRNWRNVVMGSTVRDRGGNFDRGMRFMHSTPEGFMQRPSMQSTQQVQQGNIDQSGFFAQMQKLQDEYNQALQEYYKYMSTPQYDQMQDYYAGNYQDYYGGGGGSQDNPYVGPPAPALDPPAALTDNLVNNQAAINNGNTDISKIMGLTSSSIPQPRTDSFPADAGKAWRDSQASSSPTQMVRPAPAAPTSYTGVPNVARAPAAPAAPASTMSDKFITRYDRDVQDGKVKTVAPVKTVVKPVTSSKKVKAI